MSILGEVFSALRKAAQGVIDIVTAPFQDMQSVSPKEQHRILRTSLLRASVLGANDGVLSIASLILGVATADVPHSDIIIAGVAGLVAGAMAMATGEYVSVSSQADAEKAVIALESESLETNKASACQELATIYVKRGLDPSLAKKVADQLMAHDALEALARDQLGITEELAAHPLKAAFASASSFIFGGSIPLLTASLTSQPASPFYVAGLSLASFPILGGLAAHAGGAPVTTGALRVFLWGTLSMGLTAGIGGFLGAVG